MKTIHISESSLEKLKNQVHPEEMDEYTIGGEGCTGEYKHVVSESHELNEIGAVYFSWDFDEDEYQEWLADEEVDDSDESLTEYIKYDVSFEFDLMDSETFHHFDYENLSYDEIVDNYGEEIAEYVIGECKKHGEGSFEPLMFMDDDKVDTNDVSQVNADAERKLINGEYFKGARGFILTNGVVVYTENEHNAITRVAGIDDKFKAVTKYGMIRILPNSVDIGARPTSEQRDVLRKLISCYSDDVLYLDIFDKGTEHGCSYQNPSWREVLADIDKFYDEGIVPTGGHGGMFESKAFITEKLTDIVYHFTTLEGLIGILTDDAFHPSFNEYISFTRQRSSKIGYAALHNHASNYSEEMSRCLVRLTVDGVALSCRYKAKPYSDLKPNKLYGYAESTKSLAHKEGEKFFNHVESEDRLIVNTYEVPNATKYIKRIDILFREGYLDLGFGDEYYNELEEVADLGYGSSVNVYFDEDEFNKLGSRGVSCSWAMSELQDMMFNNNRVDESLEYEVAPSQVDLSSFKNEDTLAPEIWDGMELDGRARLKLLDIADDFFETLNIKWVKPKDIILTGSICNYNWSKFSDVDLHIIVDFSEVDDRFDLVKSYFDSKKNEWNDSHSDLEIYGFPVELYVQDVKEGAVSGGEYSLEKNAWIRKPEKDAMPSLDEVSSDIKEMAATLMTYIDDVCDELEEADSHRLEELDKDIDIFSKQIKAMRKFSLDKNSEGGVGNVIYKLLRRFGYLDKMWGLKNKIYDKINSVD